VACALAGAGLLLADARIGADAGAARSAALAPWGVVALAGAVATLATRRWGRVVVGVALVGAGIAAVAGALSWDSSPWRWLAAAAGVLLAATGAFVAVRGPSWTSMAARYDAPQRRDDPWAALDRGEDPTA
jgi:protein-S-isoprenylcysteine O-methyltransferase Ste14